MAALIAQEAQRVAAVRRFNRFYTQHLGVLQDGWLQSPFTLAEARVLYEMHHRGSTTATEIGRALGLDAGYLSRILRRFHKLGLIRKAVSPNDGRQSLVSLTARGKKPSAPLEPRTKRGVGAMPGGLNPPEQERLVGALRTVET